MGRLAKNRKVAVLTSKEIVREIRLDELARTLSPKDFSENDRRAKTWESSARTPDNYFSFGYLSTTIRIPAYLYSSVDKRKARMPGSRARTREAII
jgi:hypothetical protein